jgi:F0F1-type ATP synthase assembly protein I
MTLGTKGPGEPKDSEKSYGFVKSMATASSIGLSVVLAIALGLIAGLWLDARLGTKPWLTLICTIMGVAAGFKNIFLLASRLERRSEDKDDDSQG